RVVGIDFSPEAIKYAKKRGVGVELASIQKIPFKKGAFDVVTSIDVLYHLAVTDDIGALSEMKRVLKSKGILVIRVPANKFLLSAHDVHVHTARRYDKKDLVKKLRRAGFTIKLISFVHAPIFPISFIRVMLERLTRQSAASTVGAVNPILNMILAAVLKLEAGMISGGITMPFGQGLIAVATPNRQSNLGQKRR
ncbi:MAG: class I SAM-dependent methyltransferase, partial [Microgenomates group bacterium]